MKNKEVVEEKAKAFSLFEHLDNLTINKVEYDNQNDLQTKSYEPFMINRFVSMVDFYLPLVNEINRYQLPKEVHYNYLLSSLPKRKNYFKYITKNKNNLDEIKEVVALYFKCGTRDVEEHLKILTEDQIKEIMSKYEGGRVR